MPKHLNRFTNYAVRVYSFQEEDRTMRTAPSLQVTESECLQLEQ